jgi:phage/plasmid-like protein (TIGR03299 family)
MHLFESGVFTDNEPAWHGLGTVVPDEHLTMERVFELVPLLGSQVLQSNSLFGSWHDTAGEMHIADTAGWAMNVRQADGRVLGVVRSTYELIQNDELFALGEGIVEAGGRWKTAGTLKDGAITWGMLEIPQADIAGEKYVRHLLLVNSFDGSMGIRACTTATRVVCWNTLSWAVEGTKRSYTVRHTANARERLHEAKAALGIAYDHDAHLRAISERLAGVRVTAAGAERFWKRLVPYTPEAEVSDVSRKNIDAKRLNLAYLYDHSPNLEHLRGTYLGLVQATAEWEQHYGYNRTSEQTFHRFMVDGNQPLSAKALELAGTLAE